MGKNARSPQSRKTTGTILKWVGAATAVITLIIGFSQVHDLFKDWREPRKEVSQLVKASRAQRSSGDYAGSWKLVGQALELEHDSREARAEQIQLAMEWLRNIELSAARGERTFSDIVDKLLPVLYRAADAAKGREAADILAHIGWANYLKTRDGINGLQVDKQFSSALAKDSTNVYAHAMWGYWILYPGGGGGSLSEALSHFSAAVRAGRERSFVRQLQLAAFEYVHQPESAVETIKTVDEMRLNNEILDLSARRRILSAAYFSYGREEILKRVSLAMPPEDHLETFLYLTEGIDMDENLNCRLTLAELDEKAGEIQKSLALYRSVRSDSRFNSFPSRGEVDRAVARLSRIQR